MPELEIIKKFILRELIRKKKFGGAHTPLDNITHKLPDEFINDKKDQKEVEESIKDLANSGFIILLKKKTGKGSDLHVSINPRVLREIYSFLGISDKQPAY